MLFSVFYHLKKKKQKWRKLFLAALVQFSKVPTSV